MTSLTFYGGVNEIGGNKILLEDQKTRIWLDFGQSFSFGHPYWEELSARNACPLKDYFAFGLMPEYEGLYSNEAIARSSVKPAKAAFDAVFISHAHFDHYEHIKYLHPDLPVYCGFGAKLLMWARERCKRETFDKNFASLKTFRSGETIKVGSLTVKPLAVDHSIPSAYGFIIKTSAGNVVYTGDLRLHGPRAELTEAFVEAARKAKPVALVVEGTRVSPVESRRNLSEEGVRQKCGEVVSKAKGLVACGFYPRDVDRIRTFYDTAVEHGRTFVVSYKTAFLLSVLQENKHIKVPDPLKDENVRVYRRTMSAYRFPEDEFEAVNVDCDWVRKNQGKVLLDLDFWSFQELVDIQPKKGSEYIYSMSEPFPEQGLDFVNELVEETAIAQWVKKFGMGFNAFHASGHASKQEILDIVERINADKVFPVHTEHAEMFKALGAEIMKYGGTYEV